MGYLLAAFVYFLWAVARTAYIAVLVLNVTETRWHIAEAAFHFVMAAIYLFMWFAH